MATASTARRGTRPGSRDRSGCHLRLGLSRYDGEVCSCSSVDDEGYRVHRWSGLDVDQL